MNQLPVVLVGIDETYLPDVRHELMQARVDVESEFRSPGAACESLRRSRSKVRLLIVQMGAECDTDSIRRIGEQLGPWPILALLPGQASLQEALRVNRAGASQVVQLPLAREEFQLALRQVGTQNGTGVDECHVFAVTGATGGSGATTVAINIAAEIATQFRRKTILAELTPQVGALASMLEVHPQVTLPQLLRDIHRVDDLLIENALVPVVEGFKVLGGPDQVCRPSLVQPPELYSIVEHLTNLADVIALDVPSVYNAPDSEVLEMADQVILVGLQNIHSMRMLKLYCETFPRERMNHSLTIVINRYHPDLKRFTADDFKELLRVPKVLTIANDYRSVSQSINEGRPLRQAAPQSPILRDLDVLIHALLGLERPQANKPLGKRLMSRVFGASRK